jgi:hypothetical protein
MSLSTFSVFYYGFTVDADNYQLDFNEGGSELTAELNFGDYSFTDYLTELKRALDAAGALTYTVTANRTTRAITVAASGTYSLLVSTGTHGVNAFTMMGFTGSDRTATNTYTGNTTAGSAYTPQYKLQSYIPPENYKKKRNVTVHETARGLVELVSFGSLSMIDMNIRFATDIFQHSSGPITNNASGVSDLNDFMTYLITKGSVEFMPDVGARDTYYKLILESTAEDSKGTGYKLKERFDLGIPGYYDTENLTFRVIE